MRVPLAHFFQRSFTASFFLTLSLTVISCQTNNYLSDPTIVGNAPAFIRGESVLEPGFPKKLELGTAVIKIDGKYTPGNSWFALQTLKEQLDTYLPIAPGQRTVTLYFETLSYSGIDKEITFVAESGKKYQARSIVSGDRVLFVIVDESTGTVVTKTDDPAADEMVQKLTELDQKIKAIKETN